MPTVYARGDGCKAVGKWLKGRVHWLLACRWSTSSRPVAIANRIEVRAAFVSGAQVLSSDGDFPPRKKEILPLCSAVYCSISVRCSVHFLHRKRKCSTVSFASPQSHWSDGTALMRNKYEFSLAIPVLSCASTLASFHVSRSYNCRVCLPGNAVSTFLESFPTFPGKLWVGPRLVRATLSVVDLTLGASVCGSAPCRVASLAFSLALVQSSSFSPDGSHTTVIVLLSLLSFLIDL